MSENTIKCAFITPEYYDQLVKFAIDQFAKDEPLGTTAKYIENPWDLSDFFRGIIERGTSIMAMDTANNNKVVGLLLQRIERREDQKETKDKEEESHPVLRLVDYAVKRFNPWEKLEEDVILDLDVLSVHRDYRGRNISVIMMEASFELMRKEKICLAYVMVTSAFSRAVFLKSGFQIVDEMDYVDYKVNGEVVFEPAEKIHRGFATLIKWLDK